MLVHNAFFKGLTGRRRVCAPLAVGIALACAPVSASAATRSYVVAWFTQGMYSTDGDCPKGINPSIEVQWVKDLMDTGMSEAEARDIVARDTKGDAAAHDIIINRGRVNGKPVNAYINPQTVKDPMLNTVVSKYGFGFNLDSKETPRGFEDPETGEKGVDNEMFRALGCISNLRGNPPLRSSDTETWWLLVQDYQPAWLISITADDFKNDDDASIVFSRALEHASRDANSATRADMTYRADPDPRSHTALRGRIKDGVFHASTEQTLSMVGDLLVMHKLDLHRAHVRLKILENGTIDGFIGGYQPWKQVLFPISSLGYTSEQALNHDIPGFYYVLKKHADAFPDPKTGENTAISVTWRVEGVPAFVVPTEAGAEKGK